MTERTLVRRLTNSGPISPSPFTLSPRGGEGRVRGLKPGTNLSNGVLVIASQRIDCGRSNLTPCVILRPPLLVEGSSQ